jgi:hypothetical protein
MMPVQKTNRHQGSLSMKRNWMTLQILVSILAMSVVLSTPALGQNLLWSGAYGGYYSEKGSACISTVNGGFMALGSTFSYGVGDWDIYALRLDSLGDTLWSKTYGGPATDYGHDILATDDGGFLIVGSSRSYGSGGKDLYLIKTSFMGDTLWTRAYGGVADDEGCSVQPVSGGGYIICGTTNSFGAGFSDFYLVRIDAAGDTLWTRAYGGAGGESGFAARATGDGGFIAIGNTGTFGEGYSSIYVVRVDAAGDTLWTGAYGGTRADFGHSIEITLDGGFLLVGATGSYGAGYYDAYLIKTDAAGVVQWEETYGGTKEDRAYSARQTADGGFILAGSTESFGSGKKDVYLVKTDPFGIELWSAAYGGTLADESRMVLTQSNGDFVVVGESYSYALGGSDLYVLKVAGNQSTSVEEPIDYALPDQFELSQNYPNPFNAGTSIQFRLERRASVALIIYNLLGQTIREFEAPDRPAGTYLVEWDGTNEFGSEVASGVYFYRLQVAGFSQTRKMLLLK